MCDCINKLQIEYLKEAPQNMAIYIPKDKGRILIPLKKVNLKYSTKIDISKHINYAPAETAKYCPFCGEKYDEVENGSV